MFTRYTSNTLESGIDVGKGISVGPGKFVKNNKRRALNVTKNPSNLKISVDPGEKSKI